MCDDCVSRLMAREFLQRVEVVDVFYNEFRATKEIEKLDKAELEVEKINEDFEMELDLLTFLDLRRACIRNKEIVWKKLNQKDYFFRKKK